VAHDRQQHRIGRTSEFPRGVMKLIRVAGREIGVIRLRSGRLRAIMNRCPHKGAPICRGLIGGVWESSGPGQLSFDDRHDVLVCPWHGFEFSLETGEELFWHKPARLRFYEVVEADGEVMVAI
jgi:3-phenylpropionate/trans-cinnamate dioxygenase ferredoxin subunit